MKPCKGNAWRHFLKSFFKIFSILTRKQMRICFVLVFLMFVVGIFEAVGIGLIYPLITVIGEPNYLQEHVRIARLLSIIGITTYKELVIFSILGLIGFYVLKNFLVLLQGKIQVSFTFHNQAAYSIDLFRYYMNKPYLFHVNTNFSVLLRNLSSACYAVFSDILIGTLVIMTNVITMMVIWIFIMVMDLVMALVVLLALAPLLYLILRYFRKKMSDYGEIQKDRNIVCMRWLYQGFWSVKQTKVMQKEDFFTKVYAKAFVDFSDSQKQFHFLNRIPRALIEMVCINGILLLIVVKMLFGMDSASIIPSLGVLALAAVRLMPCMNQITSLFSQVKFNQPLFDEVYDDFMEVKKLREQKDKVAVEEKKVPFVFSNEIEVKNLGFAYSETAKPVFSNVSFKIPKGSFVGIVGPSGAGKTTFVDLLLGLFQPTDGEILVDGKNISSNMKGWLDNVSYVPQSIYLIDSSIRENIAFGVLPEDIDDERIDQVLKMVELYDFVQTLDLKANTSCGDQGAKLSGGQKQRIGIARALYQNPRILVLDEATSALDTETEKQITDTITKFKGDITIIAIAHRLSTLENCDFKIKFDNGSASIVS